MGNFWLVLLTMALSFSLAANAVLVQLLRKSRKKRPRDYDAQALMADLLSGTALVKLTRIAPQDVILRSPRDQA